MGQSRGPWRDLLRPRMEIRPIATKGMFRLENEIHTAGAEVHLNFANTIGERHHKGVHLDCDVFINKWSYLPVERWRRCQAG
jgi:hypothetical protein